MSKSSIQDIIRKEQKNLADIEKQYDKWESNLDNAELLLFQYQDMIESLANDDISIDKLIDNLEKNYDNLENEVKKLENNSNNDDEKDSILKADAVLTLCRKLNSQIEEIKNTPYIKAQELMSPGSLTQILEKPNEI